MKDWSEIKVGISVYLMDPIDVTDEDEVLIGSTRPLEKCYCFAAYKDEYGFQVMGGPLKDRELYFHPGEDDITRILSSKEYKSLKNTEAAVWPKLAKFIPEIEALQEKSADIENLLLLLKAHGPKP